MTIALLPTSGETNAIVSMVVVDFSNPFLRDYLPRWLRTHGARLERARASFGRWASTARMTERREAEARGDKQSPRPLAAVFDIDEVLLSNIHLNGFTAPAGAQGPDPIDFHVADFFVDRETGKPWGRADPGDPALPGAVALLEAVAAENVQPFFITGRLESMRRTTIEDFRRAGFTRGPGGNPRAPIDLEDLGAERKILVMCPDAKYPAAGESIRPFKEGKRAEIEKTHRIVLNVGDQPSDLGLYGDRQYHLPHSFYSTY